MLMLWHGNRRPPSRGSGTSPVSVGTLPTRVPAAQPGPPGPATTPLGEAVRVTDALTSLRRLRTAEGSAAARRAAGLLAQEVDLLPGLSRLRAEVGPELAGPAWELARLRARARPVFGADADLLFLTAETLEQAG